MATLSSQRKRRNDEQEAEETQEQAPAMVSPAHLIAIAIASISGEQENLVSFLLSEQAQAKQPWTF